MATFNLRVVLPIVSGYQIDTCTYMYNNFLSPGNRNDRFTVTVYEADRDDLSSRPKSELLKRLFLVIGTHFAQWSIWSDPSGAVG